jgi:hypothetical protein
MGKVWGMSLCSVHRSVSNSQEGGLDLGLGRGIVDDHRQSLRQGSSSVIAIFKERLR